MKIVVFGASLRKQSFNKKVAALIEKHLKKKGVDAQLVQMNDYEMPMMNEDLEDKGLPAVVQKFVDIVKAADAVIISTPEYNGSIPPLLKNTIDWLSRPSPHAWLGKPILITTASPGLYGGVLSSYHSRHPLIKLGAFVYPESFNLGKAHEHLDDDGNMTDEKTLKRLTDLVDKFVAHHSKK